ncbi:DUF3298 and DUF4163 domain-containing protein [Bacillus massiliigorillae]|uniref:DUF3298 and DUF4163 domain-containing protein n=1 Tax=Bacillus massiliigorillae TaxID=1243664 RepID=UPI0003A32B0F|nr:DUF3298 and DUF4163 domain-containing protein [Bacillus massiliigorillae]
MNKLEQLKKEYNEIEIPAELSTIVEKTIRQHKRKTPKRILIGVLVAASLFIASVNISSTIAYALSDVPVVGQLVKLVTFREYHFKDETFDANIKTPAITNLENKDLEKSLNEKYAQENEKLYKEFMTDMEELKKNGGGHLGIDSGYEVKTDNKRILSIGRYVTNTVASSSTVMKYDTIDKKKELLISLPSLFKDDKYISVISENIKQQMHAQMKADKDIFYWVKGTGEEEYYEPFEKINKNQNFYISNEGKLVISFDKYDVAPGYMGLVEFEIPTKVIKKLLVSNEYIK